MIFCKVYGCPFNDGLYCRIPKRITLDTGDKRCNMRTSLMKWHLARAKTRTKLAIVSNRFNLGLT